MKRKPVTAVPAIRICIAVFLCAAVLCGTALAEGPVIVSLGDS